MTAVGGLLGAFTQPIVGSLISSMGWRNAYYSIGIAVIIIVVPTILLLLRQSPKDKGLQPYGVDMVDEDNEKDNKPQGIDFDIAKKSKAFLCLAIFFFIITAISSFAVHIPTYLADHGYQVAFVGNLMGSMMAGVFIGALLFGYLSDKIGAKKTSLLAMIIGIISIALLLLFEDNVVALVIALIFFGFVTSAIGTIAPAMTSALFGSRDYSRIYSTASIGLAVASIIALPAYGYLFDFTGSYLYALIAIIVMFAANIFFIILSFRDKDKLVKEGHWN